MRSEGALSWNWTLFIGSLAYGCVIGFLLGVLGIKKVGEKVLLALVGAGGLGAILAALTSGADSVGVFLAGFALGFFVGFFLGLALRLLVPEVTRVLMRIPDVLRHYTGE